MLSRLARVPPLTPAVRATGPEYFSARLGRRRRVWWDLRRQIPLGASKFGNLLARLRQHYRLLSAHDPESRWRSGVHWQRALMNKWNAREFARRHGCLVPELYWHGWLVSRIPFATLPEHYVLRPVMGHSRNGVFVVCGKLDLLRNNPVTPAGIRAGLRRHQARFGFVPVLAEEFLRTEQGEHRLPLEYGFYCFAGTIGAILVRNRIDAHRNCQRYYTPEWQPFADLFCSEFELDAVRPPPGCLEEMRSIARRLSAASGTFVRVDLYATDRGAVFGEFASCPFSRGYAAFAEEYFGGLWQTHCPGAL